jgi:hypothetical protein
MAWRREECGPRLDDPVSKTASGARGHRTKSPQLRHSATIVASGRRMRSVRHAISYLKPCQPPPVIAWPGRDLLEYLVDIGRCGNKVEPRIEAQPRRPAVCLAESEAARSLPNRVSPPQSQERRSPRTIWLTQNSSPPWASVPAYQVPVRFRPAWRTFDQPSFHRHQDATDKIGMLWVARATCSGCVIACYDVHALSNELCRQCGQALCLPIRVRPLDDNVVAKNPTFLTQCVPELVLIFECFAGVRFLGSSFQ